MGKQLFVNLLLQIAHDDLISWLCRAVRVALFVAFLHRLLRAQPQVRYDNAKAQPGWDGGNSRIVSRR